jgi:hypothetical protein
VSTDDKDRVRIREALLRAASPELFEVVTTCAKRFPMRDVAALIEGDETAVHDVLAGTRDDVAEIVRERSPKGELDRVASFLAKHEQGLLPCVFVVRLPSGATDYSVLALKMEVVN